MKFRDIKDRLFAIPWVYDTLRPLAAGGIDFHSLAAFCSLKETDRVFDLGCGTGRLLDFIRCERYLGVDLDARALERAARRRQDHIAFIQGDGWDEAYRTLNASVVLMIGVTHHLSDRDFHRMVWRLGRRAAALPRLVTVDVSYFPGQPLNNLLSRLDRGRFVRHTDQYERLFDDGGLEILRKDILPTRLRYVRYIGYHLIPKGMRR